MPYKKHLSKEEILKQFDLPERKSKIATLLKQDEVAYCICRSSDSSRFMIGCDACEEWYHGDCINITEKESKFIKQFFCDRCREDDPTLVTKYKQQKTEAERLEYKRRRDEEREYNKSVVDKKPVHVYSKKCGECTNCLRYNNCGRCSGCLNVYKQKCIHKICVLRQKFNDKGKDKKQKRSYKVKQKVLRRGRKRKDSSSSDDLAPPPVRTQCYGPLCTNVTRPNSKYCSDSCGLKLATNRIYQVLPQRIQEWTLSPCLAEENNKKALESVRKQQHEVRRILQELDKRHVELDAVIARGKQCKILEDTEERAEDDEQEGETSMYCITCGHEIHSRTAIRHMDKCFNKYESQSSFGSIYKTRIQGNNMFCDYYNPTNATYCKRLKVLCPEHNKEPKASHTEVCGCPLVTNVFSPTGEFCRAPKRTCVKHYCWEKLRRAEIDMERVRQWLKIDELVEKERQLRYKMATRAGVLALLLHSTYNHDLMEQLAAQQQLQQAQEQQKK